MPAQVALAFFGYATRRASQGRPKNSLPVRNAVPVALKYPSARRVLENGVDPQRKAFRRAGFGPPAARGMVHFRSRTATLTPCGAPSGRARR